MKQEFERVPSDAIVEGVIFSEPVYFDDGENMFLAPCRTAKPYHVAVIKRWNIPYLLTTGKIISSEELLALNEQKARLETVEDVEEVEELEDL